MTEAHSATEWQNWSGCVRSKPAAQVFPRDLDELRAAVLGGAGPVRVRGAGHSFTPLNATNGTLIALDHLAMPLVEPLPTVDGEVRARLHAGASLNTLSGALQTHGLAFRNLGDIDVQSLAGATATATHGTGRGFPCLSGEIRGLTLMTADGELRQADARSWPEGLAAGQVSVGALGVVLSADVHLRPAYKLHRRSVVRRFEDMLEEAPALWRQHRNFEFFVIPGSDHVLALSHDETDAPDMAENVADDHADLHKLLWLRNTLAWAPGLRRWLLNRVLRGTAPAQQIGTSWQLLASDRRMRFHEMEYHLPEAVGLAVLDEVRRLIHRQQPRVFFPIECRMTAADSAWLSPFHDGPRISIAVHVHHRDAYQWFFEQIEPIFLRHGGRPHWGKLHSLDADTLRGLYPEFDRFAALRRELDPAGRFLNAHTAALFGEAAPG